MPGTILGQTNLGKYTGVLRKKELKRELLEMSLNIEGITSLWVNERFTPVENDYNNRPQVALEQTLKPFNTGQKNLLSQRPSI